MGKVVLAGVFTLAASTALAQTEAAPEPDTVQEPAASEQADAGGPANLCQELLAFMNAPPAEEEAATGAPVQASAAAAPSDQAGSTQGAGVPAAETREQAAASESQPAQEDGVAADGEDTEPASGEAVTPQPVEETDSAQEASGQSGPAVGAPEPSSESAEGGQVQNAELKSSLSAPMPTDSTSTPKDSVMSVAEAEELAEAGDIAECQSASRELRLAGVNMPEPLLALTALDLQYQQGTEPESQAPAAEGPAAGQQDAAPDAEAPQPQTQTD